MSGVCTANAATTAPVTDIFFLTVPAGQLGNQLHLSFPKFDPSLGTLTSVDFSLVSVLGGGFAFGHSEAEPIAVTQTGFLFPFGINPGPYDFTNVSGLQSFLTTADYTGSGNFDFVPLLDNLLSMQGSPPATWTANGPGQGLTLTYDYTPAPSTSLPAALPLFATGLGALGLFGWRRKRRAQA
jgi:hypothetical protein